MLTREDFKAFKPATKVVKIPGLGEVKVRAMSAKERDYYELRCVELHGTEGWSYRAYAAMKCCVQDDGAPMFMDDDLPMLSSLPWQVLDEIWTAAATMSALSNKELAEVKKNSTTQEPATASG